MWWNLIDAVMLNGNVFTLSKFNWKSHRRDDKKEGKDEEILVGTFFNRNYL